MSNIFNMFVEYRDLFHPVLHKYIKAARLFRFDLMPTETLDDLDMSSFDELTNNFTLPFPVVAVEDGVSCCIVADLPSTPTELDDTHFPIYNGDPPIGTDVERLFMEIAPLKNYQKKGAFKAQEEDLPLEYPGSGFVANRNMMRVGLVGSTWLPEQNQWKHRGRTIQSVFFNSRGDIQLDFMGPSFQTDQLRDKLLGDLMRGHQTALEEMVHVSAPHMFILEKEPRKVPKKERNGCRKAHFRSEYTVLKPHEIRKLMKLPTPAEVKDGTGKVILERRAHWRREHTKTLRAERYGENRGKVVHVKAALIPAFWRGDSAATIGGHHYRVII